MQPGSLNQRSIYLPIYDNGQEYIVEFFIYTMPEAVFHGVGAAAHRCGYILTGCAVHGERCTLHGRSAISHNIPVQLVGRGRGQGRMGHRLGSRGGHGEDRDDTGQQQDGGDSEQCQGYFLNHAASS